jgi:hypothetical protein
VKECFGHNKMTRKENGLSLPINLQNKTCFQNILNKDVEMLYRQEKLFFYQVKPRLEHVPSYIHTSYPFSSLLGCLQVHSNALTSIYVLPIYLVRL